MDHLDTIFSIIQDLDFLNDDDNDEDYQPGDEADETECEGDGADESIGEEVEESEGDTSEIGLIAQRTRSKFAVDQIPLDSLNFLDVSQDMYGDSEADHEFLEFCQSIFADDPVPGLVSEDDDDDQDDPPFEATEDVAEDYMELLDDRSTIITEKEIVQLMDGVNEIPFEVNGHVSDWAPAWTQEHQDTLRDQMAQYVQLLTQTYLLTRDRRTLVSVAKDSVSKLKALDQLPLNQTHFRPSNLESAITLVNSVQIREVKDLKRGYNWRPCPLSLETKEIIFRNPSIFVCETLLPKHGYYDLSLDMNSREKISFTFPEDYLIALGLYHFSESEVPIVKSCLMKFIVQLLIPVKTEPQLKVHIKNVRRRNEKDNPINIYYSTKELEPFPRLAVEQSKQEYWIESCPDWLREQIISSGGGKPRRPRLLLPSPSKSVSSLATHSILKKYRQLGRHPTLAYKEIRDDDVPTGQPEFIEKSEPETKSDEKESQEEDEDDDNESQLAALMAASSTIFPNKLRLRKESKKCLAAKQRESTVKIIIDSAKHENVDEDIKDEAVIEQFTVRVKEIFPREQDCVDLLEVLRQVSNHRNDPQKFQSFFSKFEEMVTRRNGCDLIDLLIERMDPSEVQVLNRTSQYLFMKRIHSFIYKVQAMDENVCAKLHKALCQLKQCDPEADVSKIRSTVSKVINGHPYLMGEFNNLIPSEKVAGYLLSNEDDFEEMVLDDEDYLYDFITLPDDPDDAKWSTDECPCSCHPKPGSRHCLSCSLRFIDGRIWTVQDNKAELLTILTDEVPLQEESVKWSVEEDRLLLQVFQERLNKNPAESVMEEAGRELNRDVSQVAARFKHLVDLLKEANQL